LARSRSLFLASVLTAVVSAGPVLAQSCQTTTPYETWVADFKREAVAAGISQRAVDAALNGLTPDPSVIRLDRNQRHFKQSFEQFSGRMINASRLKGAVSRLKTHAATLERIEKQFGVPPEVVVAIWGLETDFGTNRGNLSTLRSLVTLAHDCRRPDLFRGQLMDALRIIDRGDMAVSQMRGGWAGEIGQTQFMPTSYMRHAVDFDGNGRRDLIGSVPDVLASTANYLKDFGWRRGEPWDEGTANFAAIQQWNKSSVYAKTVAAFATRLAQAGE